MWPGVASAVGARCHNENATNENDVTMTIAGFWRYGDWRHVATGWYALIVDNYWYFSSFNNWRPVLSGLEDSLFFNIGAYNYQQHCAQRKAPAYKLLTGRFWGLSPRRGHTLHRWWWNLAYFIPHWCNHKGNWNFLRTFYQKSEYKRPAGVYPLRDFHEIRRVCISFQDALTVKIFSAP